MCALEYHTLETSFWFAEPLPDYLNVWLFKVNHIAGEGPFESYQRTPSGVTLRVVAAGEWTVKMRGRERRATLGDIFLAVPSEPVEFSQKLDAPWEWYEIQFEGPAAGSFVGQFGLGLDCAVSTPADPVAALALFKELHAYFLGKERRAPVMLKLLFELVAACGKSPQPPGRRGGQDNLVARALDHVAAAPFKSRNIAELSEALGVERTTLYRAFKAKTGKSPQQYIDTHRMFRAEELLDSTDLPVATVATRSGFADAKYFISWFKERKGVSPGQWRREIKKGGERSGNRFPPPHGEGAN